MATHWGSPMVLRHYRGAAAPTDAGEQKALDAVSLSGVERVLDLGVGTGRTTALLLPHALTYVGLDSSPQMLDRARKNHPAADLRRGDARDLGDYPDGSFDLVVFSFNGLDCLQHAERPAFFTGVHRVLAPGGRLLFSTQNLDGPSYGQRPARLAPRRWLRRPGALAKARSAVHDTLSLGIGSVNLRRNAGRTETGEGWAWAPMRAHEFRFLVHYVRFGAQVTLLRECGFEVESAWSNRGEQLDPRADRYSEDYAHLLCRRVDAGAGGDGAGRGSLR